jgi:hypothetical protein
VPAAAQPLRLRHQPGQRHCRAVGTVLVPGQKSALKEAIVRPNTIQCISLTMHSVTTTLHLAVTNTNRRVIKYHASRVSIF